MGHKATQTALAKFTATTNIEAIERRITRDEASRELQREQTTSVFQSSTRDLRQALDDTQRNSATQLRGLNVGRADILAGRASFLRELSQRTERAEFDRSTGLRDINKALVRGVARERNEAHERGIFRSGIRKANVQEVRDDASAAEADLQTIIGLELADIKADRIELQASVDRTLQEIEAKQRDLSVQTGVDRRNTLEHITDLEGQRTRDLEAIRQSDLTAEFKAQIQETQRKLDLTLANINATGHGGGGGSSLAEINALIELALIRAAGEQVPLRRSTSPTPKRVGTRGLRPI